MPRLLKASFAFGKELIKLLLERERTYETISEDLGTQEVELGLRRSTKVDLQKTVQGEP